MALKSVQTEMFQNNREGTNTKLNDNRINGHIYLNIIFTFELNLFCNIMSRYPALKTSRNVSSSKNWEVS